MLYWINWEITVDGGRDPYGPTLPPFHKRGRSKTRRGEAIA